MYRKALHFEKYSFIKLLISLDINVGKFLAKILWIITHRAYKHEIQANNLGHSQNVRLSFDRCKTIAWCYNRR